MFHDCRFSRRVNPGNKKRGFRRIPVNFCNVFSLILAAWLYPELVYNSLKLSGKPCKFR